MAPSKKAKANAAELLSEVTEAVLFSSGTTAAEQAQRIEQMLRTENGPLIREALADWVSQFLPVTELVPEVYSLWRPLVHDAIIFVMSRLSAVRLAPKLVEQICLPFDTPPPVRLLRLIGKMPGLQKLGQILARNRHLEKSVREALIQLENGISDVSFAEIRETIVSELGPLLEQCAVTIEPSIFSEATVSAVLRFTWINPKNRVPRKGVFKVLKPHVPEYFAEDMHLLQELTEFLSGRHADYGFAERVLPDTFHEVRRLLQHEVDFRREQRTLREAQRLYRGIPRVRIPALLSELSTSRVTALSEESGVKITDAVAHVPFWRRRRIAEQLIEAVLAVPLFAQQNRSLFHADPHAGNLLFDIRTRQLVLLDWALTERLTGEQQRHLALLVLAVSMRDCSASCKQIEALSLPGARSAADRTVRSNTREFLQKLPLTRVPGTLDAMRLVERLAFQGITFPAALIMLRKALFTLDGILHEIAGGDYSLDLVLGSYLVRGWLRGDKMPGSPLCITDWIEIQSSALFYSSRWWTHFAGSQAFPPCAATFNERCR